MDELVFPASSSSCPSQASFSTAGAGHHHHEHDFSPCDVSVMDGWLQGGDNWLDLDEQPPNGVTWVGEAGSRSPPDNHHHHLFAGEPPAAAPALRRRGRKPGSTNGGAALCHVEEERQRRDKLNRLFCELRAAVPTVSRMDKASVLADAASYIGQLRHRVEQLEADDAKKKAAAAAAATVAPAAACHSFGLREKLEVQMVGAEAEAAMLRLTTPAATAAARHAPARLMLALRSLDLPVQHACVCVVGGVTVQDAVVGVPAAALRDDRALRAALLHKLQRAG